MQGLWGSSTCRAFEAVEYAGPLRQQYIQGLWGSSACRAFEAVEYARPLRQQCMQGLWGRSARRAFEASVHAGPLRQQCMQGLWGSSACRANYNINQCKLDTSIMFFVTLASVVFLRRQKNYVTLNIWYPLQTNTLVITSSILFHNVSSTIFRVSHY